MPSQKGQDASRHVKMFKKILNIVHNPVTAWLILGASIILTVVAYQISNSFVEGRAADRFYSRAKEIEAAILDRIRIYEQTLWGAVGLRYASDEVTRKEFAKYVETLDIKKHWPGIQGIGFSVPIKAENKQAHIDQIRSEGFPDYTIKPEGDREEYTSIIYLEPFDWRNQRAFGYDMWSNDIRREAMARARDEGKATVSGIITLVQETSQGVQKGFLVYVPVYQSKAIPETVEERRDQFIGWVYAPFRAADFMEGTIGTRDPNIEFEIFDGEVMSQENLLFDTNAGFHFDSPKYKPAFQKSVNITLQGHPWTLYFNTPENYLVGAEQNQPRFVAIGGIIVDLLLFYVIYSIYFLQKKAKGIAGDMTKEIRLSKENLNEQVKQTMDELNVSQEYSRLIIDTANDGFVAIDQEGLILEWNKKAEEMFGWISSEVIGKQMSQIIIPEQYRAAHEKGLKHYLETRHGPVLGKTIELTALHRNQSEFPVEITIWPLKMRETTQFNAFVRNITERKQGEERLRKAYEGLQKIHDELKRTQMQLLQSEKLASIGQLAAGVAHEINNPVGFISNNMEILQEYIQNYTKILRIIDNLKRQIEDGDIEKARSTIAELKKFEEEINLDYIMNDVNTLLEHSGRGLERIKKIVMDLRTFSREENAETMEPAKIEEIIDSILSIVQNEIKYKAELTKDYGDTVLVKCNPQRLGQVFINLLVNASQAIEEKGKITIKTYRQDKYVCIDVTDTGHGIAPENLKKIFDPFFTTKPVGQGTGLGLSVSYEIVKKHGGDIKVQSKAGEGTTFTVVLPAT